jgi:hypothetical protein
MDFAGWIFAAYILSIIVRALDPNLKDHRTEGVKRQTRRGKYVR